MNLQEICNRSLNVDKELLQEARKQFCMDIGLDWEEYLAESEKKCYICKMKYAEGTSFPATRGARCYAGKDSFFKAIICMGQLFLGVDELIYDWAVEKFADCKPEWFCLYENLRMIDRKLAEFGREIADTHIYFLPEAEVRGIEKKVSSVPETEEVAFIAAGQLLWFEQEELLQFKESNQFTSAICFSPTQPDMLAVAAVKPEVRRNGNCGNGVEGEAGSFCVGDLKDSSENIADYCGIDLPEANSTVVSDNNSVRVTQAHMAGMAGVSADGMYLWQIGINVRPEAAGKGLAVNLVRSLKEEILRRGKVPFYGTSESHTISQTVGLKAGFVPAWTEIYVRAIEGLE